MPTNFLDIPSQNDNIGSTTGNTTYELKITSDGSNLFLTPDLDIIAYGQWSWGTFPLTPSAAPDADYEVANKKYVDDSIAGIDEHDELGNLNWAAAGHTIDANIVMADNSITGLDTLTFTDTAGTIAGIQNQNLVDKSAAEIIAGAWDFHGSGTKLEALTSTANDSTLTLTDDGSQQTLTGSLGGLYIKPSSGSTLFTHATTAVMFVLEETSSNGFFFAADSGGGGSSGIYFTGAGDFTFGKYFVSDVFTVDSSTLDVTFYPEVIFSDVVTHNANVAFDLGTRTIAGIQNQNLLDKSAVETVSGTYTFSNETVHSSGLDVSTSGRFDSNVADAAGAKSFWFKPSVALTSGSDRYLMMVENSAGTDVLRLQSDKHLWLGGGVFTGGGSTSVQAVDGNYMYKNWTGVLSSVTYRGLRCQLQANYDTGSSSTKYFVGGAFNCSFNNGGTYTGSATAIIGGEFECYNSRDNMTLSLQFGGRFQSFLTTTLATGSSVTSVHAGHFRNQFSGQNYTVTNGFGIYINSPTGPGSGTTITNAAGIYVFNQQGIGTNHHAIWIDGQTADASGAGGNLYMEGGDYDDGHLQLDTSHMWQDQTNTVMRIKNSAPTATTQGLGLEDALASNAAVAPSLSSNGPSGMTAASSSWLPVWIGNTKYYICLWTA